MDRSHFTTWDSVKHLWYNLGLPLNAVHSLDLVGGDDSALPSSFKIGHLAQSSIAVSGLLAALLCSYRRSTQLPKVKLDRRHAVVEFSSEKLYLLNGQESKPTWGSIGGLHESADGYVRVHDSFPNHQDAALDMLDCPRDATKFDFAQKVKSRLGQDLEDAAIEAGAVIFAMRSYKEWDELYQAQAIKDFPITITKVADSQPYVPAIPSGASNKCLAGFRVLEMSRVIAAPVAGRTLAAHGADVLWVTSPHLPDLPELDRDVGRGKRTAQLDLNEPAQEAVLLQLIGDADVFLQSYRPGGLVDRGLSAEKLIGARNGQPLVCASLTAWGTDGPWSNRRGFDSIVQTASGMNVSEAEHYGNSVAPRPMPCQALDHAAGYFLASGIMTALYRQAIQGGSYQVDVSLAGVMKYLRSLGQYEGDRGFQCSGYDTLDDVPVGFTETRDCAFGKLQAIKHSVKIEDVEVGWEHMPKPLGSDQPVWLPR